VITQLAKYTRHMKVPGSWEIRLLKTCLHPKKCVFSLKIGQIVKMKNTSGGISWRCQKTEFE
jgi:hypothetical protein